MNYIENKNMTTTINQSNRIIIESGSHKIIVDKNGNVTFNSELDKLHFLNQ